MATVHAGRRQSRNESGSLKKGGKKKLKQSGGRKNGDGNGLKVKPHFCPTDVADPFDTVEWELRTASIKDETGGLLFEQNDCEIPSFWSQLATNVVVSKYFYGEVDTEERETSVRQIIHRVTRAIADWGIEDGYFASKKDGENFYRELTWLCLHQHGAFNSPVWFNVGLYQQYDVSGARCNWCWDAETDTILQPENPYEYPQASACFIQSVDDNMEDIMRLATSEAMLFKFGSGTGTDLSTIRSKREKRSGGGIPSGPLSFMRVYDQIAAVVKSGGKTRRAAKMQSLKVWHPDILEFIECKHKEEEKALCLISKGGYEANFNGEAYSSILFQNANLSVRVTDEFMQAVDNNAEWQTRYISSEGDGPVYQAPELLNRMAECAWECGDPGIQYDTTINEWHTCPNSGRINASNPCSEYMFLDDTACNLASINLMKYRQPDGEFDVKGFQNACRLFFIAQEILVDHASYPTDRIALNSHRYRPLGLGYSNLGSLAMSSGHGYDSAAARGLCGSLTAILHGTACRTSAELAAAVGTFEGYADNEEPFMKVMNMHRDAVEEIDEAGPDYLQDAARKVWDEVLEAGEESGFRNAQSTVLAPTGTISFMMDCDTTGIEPDIAIVKYKHLAGGGMLKIVNQTVPLALEAMGYDESEIASIAEHIDEHDTIEGAPALRDEHVGVFDCAFRPANGERSIEWRAHVSMMAAAQPFLSGAISKTVNMPADVTPDDIADAYRWGWELGLKALAIYRDGSKGSQPLATSLDEDETSADSEARPSRRRLPDTRQSLTHKFSIQGHEGYITVGLYDDGQPGEVFITMAKEGSTVGGLMDAFGTAISMSLQYGVPLSELVRKFSYAHFEPSGFTTNKQIRNARSVVDYIFRWLGIQFIDGYLESQNAYQPESNDESSTIQESKSGYAVEAKEPAAPSKNGVSKNGASKNGSHGSLNGSTNGSTNGSANGSRKESLNRLNEEFSKFQIDAPSCDSCGSICVRNGNCYLCHNCGQSMGCS